MMQGCSVVLGVPSAFAESLMVEWLSMKSVVFLDSAMCSHVNRKPFLSLYSEWAYGWGIPYTGFDKANSNQCNKLLRWVSLRNVRLHSLYIVGSTDMEVLSKVFQNTGEHVKFVKVCRNNNLGVILPLIITSCTKKLETLVLLGCYVPLSIQDLLNDLIALEQLEISHCTGLTPGANVPLSCVALKRLTIEGNINSGVFSLLCKSVPNLTSIKVLFCKGINYQDIALTGPSLRVLELHSVHCSDAELTYILERCSNIEEVALKKCTSVTGVGIIAVGTHLLKLKRLFLAHNGELDDNNDINISPAVHAVRTFLELRGGTLECLEFEGENSIDRECIRAISMHCANLRTFSLKGDISLGYAPLAEMLAACKKLQHFTLHVSLHENILRAIACNCANFHTLDLSASVMEWSTLVVEMLNTIVIDEGMKLEQLDLPRYLDGLGILPQTVQMWRNSRPLLKITSKNYW